MRIGTNPRAYPHPLDIAEARDVVATWLERPMVQIIAPGARHWEIFSLLCVDGQATGPLVMDAHLAALAIEHGAVLHTNDADFTRFRGVQLHNPLATD
jgi:toxin-antitoxin system PIN domain toxin